MNEYRYSDPTDVVAAAKRGLPESALIHLFGASHPMIFALTAVLGCDLFNSAAYAIYARDNRYMTVRTTEHLLALEIDRTVVRLGVCPEESVQEYSQNGYIMTIDPASTTNQGDRRIEIAKVEDADVQ